jgi:hypothetical protein
VVVLASLVMGKLAAGGGVPGFVAFLVGFLVAMLAGLVNGVLVTRIKLPPFIVTLGTLSIFTALTLIYAQGQTISLPQGGFLNFTGRTIDIGRFHLTVGVLLMLLLYVGFAYALRQTAWGRHLYATGDDAEAARAVRERFGIEAEAGAEGVRLRTPDGAGFVPRLCAELTVPVHAVTVTPPTLDDVFLRLTGDTTGDANVNSADIAQTKSQSGQGVTNANFREDLTTDGNINSADIALVKSKSGTGLP